jgi:hypothetical protein
LAAKAAPERVRSILCGSSPFAINARIKASPFFFKQWGGFQKKKAGRELDGRTYDDMPPLLTVNPPSEPEQERRVRSVEVLMRKFQRRSGDRLIQWPSASDSAQEESARGCTPDPTCGACEPSSELA